VAAAAGAATADLVYATLAVVAGAWLTVVLEPFITPLRLIGGGVLIGFGVRGFISLRSARESIDPETAHDAVRQPGHRTYFGVLGLTLLNPATIIYFTALTVGLPFLAGPAERAAFAIAAGLASLSWQLLLAVFGAGLRRGSGHRIRVATVALGNALIIAMGGLIIVGS